MTGMELKLLRDELDWTQAQLADRIGRHWNTIARWERNEVRITPSIEKLIWMVYARNQ